MRHIDTWFRNSVKRPQNLQLRQTIVSSQWTTVNRVPAIARPMGSRMLSKAARQAEQDREDEILADPTRDRQLHGLYLRVGLLLDYLGVKEGKDEEDFLKNHTISPGHATLEWVFPSPPPEHLFEEPALVKDVPGQADDDELIEPAQGAAKKSAH